MLPGNNLASNSDLCISRPSAFDIACIGSIFTIDLESIGNDLGSIGNDLASNGNGLDPVSIDLGMYGAGAGVGSSFSFFTDKSCGKSGSDLGRGIEGLVNVAVGT